MNYSYKPKVGEVYYYLSLQNSTNYGDIHLIKKVFKAGDSIYGKNYFSSMEKCKKIRYEIFSMFSDNCSSPVAGNTYYYIEQNELSNFIQVTIENKVYKEGDSLRGKNFFALKDDAQKVVNKLLHLFIDGFYPKEGETYYYVTQDYSPDYINAHVSVDQMKGNMVLYSGNYFSTYEKAQKIADKIQRIFKRRSFKYWVLAKCKSALHLFCK